MTTTAGQILPWTKHGSDECPYDNENACVDAWVIAHREQLDRFTAEGLADLAAELPEGYALDGENSGTRQLHPDLPEHDDPTPGTTPDDDPA